MRTTLFILAEDMSDPTCALKGLEREVGNSNSFKEICLCSFPAKISKRSAIDLVVGKMVIRVSSEYKYLGVVLMTYKSALADRTEKAFRAFWGICSTEYSGNQLPISVYKKLFESVVAPVVDYGALFWSHRFSDQEVEKVQFKAYRYSLGVGRKHPLASLSGDMCWMPSKCRHNYKQYFFGLNFERWIMIDCVARC